MSDREGGSDESPIHHVEDLYRNWFLEYASYVILDRAVPNVDDGLKPVQRRLLHAMYELEDGRYNKAANIIGHTMRYHPHGDAAIGDALIKLGQKELLIDTQGNWGNLLTGDRAAAARYIEARLTPFAKEVIFNPKTTQWLPSYDGRNKEPVALPVKFPLLLAQGAEGIAVGLSTRILPHNFCELIKASMAYLKGRKQKIEPDFPSGGIADFSLYQDGKKGGKVKVRAVIDKIDQKTLRIVELPFGVTTSSLIDSIISANDKGKIKIKKVEDNTAESVDILISLPSGVSSDVTLEALYAFTDCEVSISTNCCIIRGDKPHFIGVTELLHSVTDQTVELLKAELEIKKGELNQKLHFMTLEQLFIEHKIYRKIETCESFEDILKTIEKGLKPFSKQFIRPLLEEDLVRLTEIKIKRISKYDKDRADEAMAKVKDQVKEVTYDLEHLTDYALRYYEGILEKFGKNRGRKTKKTTFDEINARQVVLANQKLYMNPKDGFVGTSLKKEEFIADCSDLDEFIAFTRAGQFKVFRPAPKVFIGKDIIHIEPFQRGNDRRVYHMIYRDGRQGGIYAKRFVIGGVTREKDYDLTKGSAGTRVLHFSVNPNGEAERVDLRLKPKKGKKNRPKVSVEFGEMEVKSRAVKGQLVTKDSLDSIEDVTQGDSTLAAQKVWFDFKTSQFATKEVEQGQYIGELQGDEKMLALYADGGYELVPYSEQAYFSGKVEQVEVFSEQVVSVVYYDQERKEHYVKRFQPASDQLNRRIDVLPDGVKGQLLLLTTNPTPLVKITFQKNSKGTTPRPELVRLAEFIEVKGLKARGNRLAKEKVKKVELL